MVNMLEGIAAVAVLAAYLYLAGCLIGWAGRKWRGDDDKWGR
jgi:hypothetical protein